MISHNEIRAVNGLLTFFGDKPVVLDVGSNKGHFADVILSFFPNRELHLIEPNTMLLNYTRIKYEYHNGIYYHEVGLSNKTGQSDFYYFENYNNELSSLYKSDTWEGLPMQSKKITTLTLPEFCKKKGIEKIDYLKLDVEGVEAMIMEPAWDMDIGVIQVEYSEHYTRAGRTFHEIYTKAKEHGYSIYRYDNENYEEVESPDCPYDNYYITRFNVRNHSVGWNKEFIKNTFTLGPFNFMLEVGSFEGLNAAFMCRNLLEEGGRIICVDPLDDYYLPGDTEHSHLFRDQYARFKRNTHGLPIELRRQRSDIALPEMHEFRFDFIYIDGDHTGEAVFRDIVNSMKICKVGGYILIDDYLWREETTNGINRFLKENEGRYELIEKGYQVLIRKLQNL